jgi:hypothetical protein
VKVHRIQGIAFSSYRIETGSALFLVDGGLAGSAASCPGRCAIVSAGQARPRVADAPTSTTSAPSRHCDRRLRLQFIIESREALAAVGATSARQAWTRSVQWLANSAMPLLAARDHAYDHSADGERLDAFA